MAIIASDKIKPETNISKEGGIVTVFDPRVTTTRLDILFPVEEWRPGRRHFLEHLVSHQVINKDGDALFTLLSCHGGKFVAWTNARSVVFSFKFPSKHLEKLIGPITQTIFRPDIKAINRRVYRAHLEQIRQEIRNYFTLPQHVLREELQRQRFSPPLQSSIGNESDLDSISPEELNKSLDDKLLATGAYVVVHTNLDREKFSALQAERGPIPATISRDRNGFKFLLVEKPVLTSYLAISLIDPKIKSIEDRWLTQLIYDSLAGERWSLMTRLASRYDPLKLSSEILRLELLGSGFSICSFHLPNDHQLQTKVQDAIQQINHFFHQGPDENLAVKLAATSYCSLEPLLDNQDFLVNWYSNLLLSGEMLVPPSLCLEFLNQVNHEKLTTFFKEELDKDYLQLGIITDEKSKLSVPKLLSEWQ